MRKIFFILLSLSSLMASPPCVLVSIAPQKFLVEQIAGEEISVSVIVPDGASPHSYEPSPREALALQKAEIWFRIGESFETRLIKLLSPKMTLVDQREVVDLLPSGSCPCCPHLGDFDPHIWLTPALLKKEAKQIADVLSKHYPHQSAYFAKNLAHLEEKLDLLDKEISQELAAKKASFLMVSHPAFGYFCKEYGLKQIAIEKEGKEPTLKELLQLLKELSKTPVSTIYLQKQYSLRAGQILAKQLHAEVVMVDPYQEDVIENLRFIARTL